MDIKESGMLVEQLATEACFGFNFRCVLLDASDEWVAETTKLLAQAKQSRMQEG